MSHRFWVEVRRALITLGWAILKYDGNRTLLSLLGVIAEPPVAVDLQKVYTIGEVQITIILKSDETEEPEDRSPSSTEQEVQSCRLLVKVKRFHHP